MFDKRLNWNILAPVHVKGWHFISLLVEITYIWYSISWDIITQRESAVEHFRKYVNKKKTL